MNAALASMWCIAPTVSRDYMPRELTPFFHTTIHAELSEEEQRTYNHLHALYFHEQIIFFEQSIICPTLGAVRLQIPGHELQSSIDQFMAEETRHSSAFYELLREVAPDFYVDSARYFIRNGPVGDSILRWCVERPSLFPMYVWLVLLLEERAMHCSRIFIAHQGDLYEPFFAIQRQHLADEVEHVQWDEAIINRTWPVTPIRIRRINVMLMDWMLREFIVVPKRAAIRVLAELVSRHPRLRPSLPRLKRGLRKLGSTPEFQRSIFCAPVAPRSERLMRYFPEFDNFRSYWFRHEN